MAQTIQIKSSTTAGNVPSSLATGELAINVADGSLFFGSATTVYDDFRFGGLIVTGTTTLEGAVTANGTIEVDVVSATTITGATTVLIPDNGKLKLGNAGDLEIYHNGSNSIIEDTGTGTIFYRSGTQTFQNAAASKTMATFNAANSVDLNYNNNTKFKTTNTGIDVTGEVKGDSLDIDGNSQLDGTITVGVDDTGYDVKLFGATSGNYMLWDESENELDLVGNLNISGTTTYIGAISGTGSITAIGNLDIDGTSNLDNTDIDGTFTMDGTAFDVNGTTTVAIDNTNTTNGVTINTVTTNSKVFIGHTSSETTIQDNLNISGDTSMSNGSQIFLGNGTAGDPAITFLTDPDTGIRLHTAGSMRLVVAGADQLAISDGVMFPLLNGDYDLGHVSYYFKDLYIGSINCGGDISGATLDISGDADIDGTTNLDAVDIDGAVQVDNTITVGVDDTGYDVKFFGDTASAYMLWDTSDDDLVLAGSATLKGNRSFEKSSTTDKNLAQGDIIYVGGGSTIEGDLVIMTSAATWTSAQANAVTSGTSMLGIALGTDPDVDGVLLRGTYTLDHDVGNTQGAPLYLSDGTAGQATATIPDSSGDIVRIIGYNIGDDDEIWFDPDKTWVELS